VVNAWSYPVKGTDLSATSWRSSKHPLPPRFPPDPCPPAGVHDMLCVCERTHAGEREHTLRAHSQGSRHADEPRSDKHRWVTRTDEARQAGTASPSKPRPRGLVALLHQGCHPCTSSAPASLVTPPCKPTSPVPCMNVHQHPPHLGYQRQRLRPQVFRAVRAGQAPQLPRHALQAQVPGPQLGALHAVLGLVG
jgi:hypothetical protein